MDEAQGLQQQPGPVVYAAYLREQHQVMQVLRDLLEVRADGARRVALTLTLT